MRRLWGVSGGALALTLAACVCPGPSSDAGVDAGPSDSGLDAGRDAGERDGGADGGSDGGPRDAGALPDAGALRCLQVLCTGDNTCSLDDGECRCNGVKCQAGATCQCPQAMPGCQPHERVCAPSTRCDSVACAAGATCDATDGLCKCGGPSGPVCSPQQVCAGSVPAQCVGGCAESCLVGTSCDDDDGQCKCGGRSGLTCAAGELCVATGTLYACRLGCAALGGACPAGQNCFIDTRPPRDVAYCAFASALLAEGEACAGPTECFDGRALHCAGLSPQVPVGVCREACDPVSPRCPAGRRCLAQPELSDAGFCVP